MEIEGKRSKLQDEQANLPNTSQMPERLAAFLRNEANLIATINKQNGQEPEGTR